MKIKTIKGQAKLNVCDEKMNNLQKFDGVFEYEISESVDLCMELKLEKESIVDVCGIEIVNKDGVLDKTDGQTNKWELLPLKIGKRIYISKTNPNKSHFLVAIESI